MLKIKKKNSRQLKISELIKRELAQIFQNYIFSNNKNINFNLIVSEVNVSPDLKTAVIYIYPFFLSDEKIDDQIVLEILLKEEYKIKKSLGSNLSLRFVPKLIFEIDKLFEETQKIDKLFNDPKVAQDLV